MFYIAAYNETVEPFVRNSGKRSTSGGPKSPYHSTLIQPR